jgi:hypothetical protein
MVVNFTQPGRPDLLSHTRHIGACLSCQRAQFVRWSAQLASVTPA